MWRNDDTVLILTIFMTWSNLFPIGMGENLYSIIIVMCFQACSNSAYPMHLGERYRTSGPLVLNT